MLISLTRRISDHFLPEAFYESKFTSADDCPQCSPEEEDDLVIAFDYKMQDALAEKSWSTVNLDYSIFTRNNITFGQLFYKEE